MVRGEEKKEKKKEKLFLTGRYENKRAAAASSSSSSISSSSSGFELQWRSVAAELCLARCAADRLMEIGGGVGEEWELGWLGGWAAAAAAEAYL